jgi:hypothetical protein
VERQTLIMLQRGRPETRRLPVKRPLACTNCGPQHSDPNFERVKCRNSLQ